MALGEGTIVRPFFLSASFAENAQLLWNFWHLTFQKIEMIGACTVHIHICIKRWMLRIWSFLSIHQIDSHINACNQRTPLTKLLVHSINCYKITLHMIESVHSHTCMYKIWQRQNGKRTVGKRKKTNQFFICARRHARNQLGNPKISVGSNHKTNHFLHSHARTHTRRSMIDANNTKMEFGIQYLWMQNLDNYSFSIRFFPHTNKTLV